MPGVTPQHSCLACDEPIHFLQDPCPACGVSHAWFYVADCRQCGEETDYLDGPCECCGAEYSPWRVVEMELFGGSDVVTVPKDAVPRPMTDEYRRHLGTMKGQWADYRRVLDDGSEFHVRAYTDHYEIHLDEVSAIDDPAWHMVRYTPRVVAITGIGVVEGVQQTVERSGRLVNDTLRAPFRLLPDTDEQ